MNSNRYSKLTALLVVLTLALSAVASPAAAATIDAEGVPNEAEVGSEVSATYTLTDLYEGDTPREWTLEGATNMTNASWSVTAYDNAGDQVGQTENYGGESFEYLVSADAEVDEIEVSVTGTAPEIEEFTYSPEETFRLTEFTEVRDGGGETTLESWDVHHYTQDSKDARNAIEDAEAAIADAEDGGADVSDAEESLDNAVGFYENADFENAISNAESAQSAAEDAQSSAETRSLLMYGGAGLVALLVIGGVGYVLYQRSQDDYDKLG